MKIVNFNPLKCKYEHSKVKCVRNSASQSRIYEAAIVCSLNSYGHYIGRAEFISHVMAESKIRDIRERNTSDEIGRVLKFHEQLLKYSPLHIIL